MSTIESLTFYFQDKDSFFSVIQNQGMWNGNFQLSVAYLEQIVLSKIIMYRFCISSGWQKSSCNLMAGNPASSKYLVAIHTFWPISIDAMAPVLKPSSNSSLPFAWIIGPATDPSLFLIVNLSLTELYQWKNLRVELREEWMHHSVTGGSWFTIAKVWSFLFWVSYLVEK